MKNYIPGLTDWQIDQICNLGKTEKTKQNPNFHIAKKKIKDDCIYIQYRGVNQQSYYHEFDVYDNTSNKMHVVAFLAAADVHTYLLDASMIREVCCTCNKDNKMIGLCEHACATFLSLKSEPYRTEPLFGNEQLPYEVTPAHIKVGKAHCDASFLPTLFPGPRFALAINQDCVLSWMTDAKASNAWIFTTSNSF